MQVESKNSHQSKFWARCLWVAIPVVAGSLHAAALEPVGLKPDTLITDWRVAGPVQGPADGEALKQDLMAQDALTLDGRQYPIRSMTVNAKRKVGVGRIPQIPMWKETDDTISLPNSGGPYYAGATVSSDNERPISLVIMVRGPFQLWFNGQSLDLGDLAGNPKKIDMLPYDQPHDEMMQSYLTVTVRARAGLNTVLVRLDPVEQSPGKQSGEVIELGLKLNFEPAATGALPRGVLGAADFRPSPEHPVCDRGDGTGIFPGANPPAFWDEKKGVNIRWHSDMPGPGKCGAIVVVDKVFTLAEPNVLVCCDAQTGRILWQKANDHLELFPQDEAEMARKEWSELWSDYRRLFELSGEHAWLGGGNGQIARGLMPKEPFNDSAALKERLAELETELKATYGWAAFDEIHGGGHDPQVYPNGETWDDFQRRVGNLYRSFGLHFPKTTHWQWRGYCDSTPCSDGSNVYATIGTGQTVCYDKEGNRKWMVWSSLCRKDDPNAQRVYRYYTCGVDPYLIGDLLITQIGNYIRALNKESGKTVWEQHIKYGISTMNGTCCGQARPMQLGDLTVLISPDGRVYRLSDGEILMDPDGWKLITGRTDEIIPATGRKDRRSVWNAVSAGTPAINGDTAYFGFGSGIRALEYARTGDDKITVREKWVYELPDDRFDWSGRQKVVNWFVSHAHESAVFFDASPLYDPLTDRIWFGPHKTGEIEILDANTGQAIQEGTTPYWAPEGNGCAIAGGLIFAQTFFGITHVYGRQDGLTPIGENEVRLPIVRDQRDRTMTWEEYKKKWFDRGFLKTSSDRTVGELFFHGDAIYMRTDTALVCIGTGT